MIKGKRMNEVLKTVLKNIDEVAEGNAKDIRFAIKLLNNKIEYLRIMEEAKEEEDEKPLINLDDEAKDMPKFYSN